MSVGLAFTTPLDRRAERNRFRAAQIAYQQARRNYVAAEDQVKLDVRQSVRTLQEIAQLFEIDRRAVRISAREFGLAQTERDATQRGLNLDRAAMSLRFDENALINDWLDYENTRLNLFRDLGTMQIDQRGLWNDPFYQQTVKDVEQDVLGDSTSTLTIFD